MTLADKTAPSLDNLLSMTVHTGATLVTYYAVKDHLGTVHALTDGSGTGVESYRFDAWGNVLEARDAAGSIATRSPLGNRYLWQGREYDWQSGWYYFRARWYDPRTGRWLSNDPIGISGGLNQYVFCGNDPVNSVDPFGLKVRLAGSVDEQRKLLATLGTFLRGKLSVGKDGYVGREACNEDENYDTMFDKLIAAEATYSIAFVDDKDVVWIGGAGFSPRGFAEGGSIRITRDPSGYNYSPDTSWLPTAMTEPQTLGTLMSHEIGHAFTHVQELKQADLPRNQISESRYKKLHGIAKDWQNKVMGRMGKPGMQ
jgi:RHS repeat-associated protein